MAEFAYSFNDSMVVKDYEKAAAYTTPKKGDFVVLNAGKIEKVVALTGTAITGVLEGGEFDGLVAQGQPYAATNAALIADAANRKIVKVRVGKEVVYRIPKGDVTAADIGTKVGFDANGAGNKGATGKPLTVVDVQGEFAFISIA